jgi:hypothetical protein
MDVQFFEDGFVRFSKLYCFKQVKASNTILCR